MHECPHCHSKNVDYLTRIIGYMKRVSNFSVPRQEEAHRRFYAGEDKYTVKTTKEKLYKESVTETKNV